jgi:predicted enzyme related to lactoylglutathione lyase
VTTTDDKPRLFRLNIEVGDIDRAASFYSDLLGIEGRPQPGSRCYFRAGPVTLQIVEAPEESRRLAAKALYFLTGDLDGAHNRAQALGCLSSEMVHGMSGGEPAVRPWGERSFYADDPWGNPLCFVEEGTVYQG